MKLKLRRKHKKRIISRVKQALEAPLQLNECWSMDFMGISISQAFAGGFSILLKIILKNNISGHIIKSDIVY